MTITVNQLHDLFTYRDGYLYYNRSRGRAAVGSVAGSPKSHGRYRWVKIDGKEYPVHSLIVFMHAGFYPKSVDHINGDGNDNRLENLRACSLSENQHNQRLSTRNTSGKKGVSWSTRLRKWQVLVAKDGKTYYGGVFALVAEADKAARSLRERLHSSFVNHGA